MALKSAQLFRASTDTDTDTDRQGPLRYNVNIFSQSEMTEYNKERSAIAKDLKKLVIRSLNESATFVAN